MNGGAKDGKGSTYGAPRAVGGLLPAILKPAFRKRAPATAQLLADWPSIMGPAIAAVSVPRKLSAGSLSIACSGPIAMELQHLAPQILQRINAHFGQNLVLRLKFVADLAASVAIIRRVPPRALAAAEAAVADMPDSRLRAALIGLGGHLLTRPSTPDPDLV